MRRLASRRTGFVLACVILLTSGLPPGQGATDPGDQYSDADVLLLDETWTGTVVRERGIVIPAGRTLTLENATLVFNTTTLRHQSLLVDAGGRLVVRDSAITNNATGMSEYERTRRYWEFNVKGQLDMARSVLRYGGDIAFELDTAGTSIIRDSQLLWMSRGIHVLRTNLTTLREWDLVLENVRIADMPVITGSGTPDIGGAIGILNGNVLIRNVTIERARTTGLFIDRSAVSEDTDRFGSRVEARDLVVLGGSPPGLTGEGSLLYVRTTGSFLCEQCTFVSPLGTGVMAFSDGHDITMRETTVVDATMYFRLPATTPVRFEGLDLHGPAAGIRYRYGNDAAPVFERTSFDGPGLVGAFAEEEQLRTMRGVWWGDASGPRDANDGDGSVPAANGGSGRAVVGSIDYSGWATQPVARPGLRVSLGALPEAILPGAVLDVPFTVTNGGGSPLVAQLQAAGTLPVALSTTSVALAPGGSATGSFRLAVPESAAAGSALRQSLLATADGHRAADVVTSKVGEARAKVDVTSPAPGDALFGAFRVDGVVREPLGGVTTSAWSGPPDANGDHVDDRAQGAPGEVGVMVRHDGSREPALRAAIEAAGGRVVRAYSLAPILWVIAPSHALPTLAQQPGVRDVWWNEPVEAQLAYATRTARARTSLEGVMPTGTLPDADYAGVWSGNPLDGYQGPVGRGALIAVIDSGIDKAHASLDDMDDTLGTVDPKVIASISTFTVLATEGTNVALSSVVVPGTHGTWVAGTAAGTGASFVGPRDAPLHGTTGDDPWMRAGVAPGARIVDVDAFEDTSEATRNVPPVGLGLGTLAPDAGFGLVLEGFEAVASWNRGNPEDPIRIVQISLSLSSTDVDHPVNQVADALAETGVLIVVAVGNDHPGAVVPATAKKVLAVGATRMRDTVARGDDARASFSDASNAQQVAAGRLKPELMAPGSPMWMPAKDSIDGYGTRGLEGTSFAAPIVSGVAALVLEANPALHPAQVKEILIRSAEPRGLAAGARYTDIDLDFEDDLADGGWDVDWGYGYVDAEEAVRLARATTPRAPPPAPSLVLHASGSALTKDEPESAAQTEGVASWSYVPAASMRLGDGDPATDEVAVLVLDAPTTRPGAVATRAIATLWLDDTLLARFTHVDDTVSTSVSDQPMRLPIQLGKTAEVVYRGPDTGRLNVTGDLGVLDANGAILVPAGSTLRLDVQVNHTGGAPAPILTGAGSTRITFTLDPASLPNGAAPGPVVDTAARWNATSVVVAWGPAPDDRGVGAYEVLRDGHPLDTVSGRSYQLVDDDVTPGSAHRYRVRAIDVHGLVGPLGPEVSVVLPPALGRSVVVDVAGVSALATDDAGDGTHHRWHAQLAPPLAGRYTLRATLFEDGEGFDVHEQLVEIKAAVNLPPVVTLPFAELTLHGARAIAVAFDDANGVGDIASREWRVDGGDWAPLSGALPLDARVLGEGERVVEVRATDVSGASGVASLLVRSAPWTARIDAPAVWQEGVATRVVVPVNGTGAGAAAPLLLGSGAQAFQLPLVAGSSGFETSVLPLRSGFLRLEVRDGEDHLVERTVVVDRPPEARIYAPITTATRLDSIVLADVSIDDGGISERRWTLPNGTTSSAAALTVPLRDARVGEHDIKLRVSNVNGLVDETSVRLTVVDLAPRISVSPFKLGSATVSNAYTGETIGLVVEIDDPEGDPLTLVGGLAVDGVNVALAPGRNELSVRPMQPGELRLDLTVRDAWREARASAAIPVAENAPPVASLTGPTSVPAGVSRQFDTSASHDPDRGLLTRRLDVEGRGTFNATKPMLALPMGAWNATLTVTDSSQATATKTLRILADDWMSVRVGWASAPTLRTPGVARIGVVWHDATPVEGARVTLTIAHTLPGFEQRHEGTTGADGFALIPLEMDLNGLNLPGDHTMRVVATHESLPAAPVQDEEEAQTVALYRPEP